jgi:hypothetical protein
MKKFAQYSLLIFILLIFLVSTNGLSIYHHLCACKSVTYYSLVAGRDCCTALNHMNECTNENCSHSNASKHTPIKNQIPSGCSTERSFYKVPSVNNFDSFKISFKVFSNVVFLHFIPTLEVASIDPRIEHFKEKPPLIPDILISQHVLII